MSIYGWINNRKFEISIITIWSLFVSNLIIVVYAAIHSILFQFYDFNEYIKILIYIITGTLSPFFITYLFKTKIFTLMLLKTNHKTINSDIFDDVIDYDKKTMLRIYMKNSNVLYIGTFKFREEKGNESYIALIDYASMNSDTKDIIFKPDDNDMKSSVVINLRDIERIELIYEQDSEIWKRMISI